MEKVGIIGCGNMGSAIARGITAELPDIQLLLYDADQERLEKISGELNAKGTRDMESLLLEAGIIILAVKPQIFSHIYRIVSAVNLTGKKYISIAAGIPLESLSSGLGSTQIVRFMPNIAASVGKAVTAVCSTADCSSEFLAKAFSLAETFGTAFTLDEKLFPAFVGISGSAIAFFYRFLHAVAQGGTREGLPYAQAVNIAAETFAGAVELMKASSSDPSSLITAVCSPAGTTIEGIYCLEKGNLHGTVMEAVHEAAEKARNM